MSVNYLGIFFVLLFTSQSIAADVDSKPCDLSVQIVEYPPLAIPPNSKFNATDQWQGKNFLYLDALFNKANCQYHIVPTPFGRGINLLQQGKIDMTLNLSKTPEREKHLHFLGPQRTEKIQLAYSKGITDTINSWQDFSSKKLTWIWQTGAYFGEKLEQIAQDQHHFNGNFIYIADNLKMLELIRKNRADGFFVESSFLQFHLTYDVEYSALQASPLIINAEQVYFAFSKVSVDEQLQSRFKAAFEQLAEQGVWQRLDNTKYILPAKTKN